MFVPLKPTKTAWALEPVVVLTAFSYSENGAVSPRELCYVNWPDTFLLVIQYEELQTHSSKLEKQNNSMKQRLDNLLVRGNNSITIYIKIWHSDEYMCCLCNYIYLNWWIRTSLHHLWASIFIIILGRTSVSPKFRLSWIRYCDSR